MAWNIFWNIFALFFAVPQDYPDHVGVVNDFANEIDKGTKAKIEKAIEDAKVKADVRIVVVTVTSLDGRSVEDYTIGLTKKWGVGQKGKNNGILFLHAPKERKIRIENGYGVESRLTDVESKMIIERMIPLMKSGKFAEAMLQGVEEIGRTVSAPEKQEKQSVPMSVKDEGGLGTGGIILIVGLMVVFLIVILIWVSSSTRMPPPRKYSTFSSPPRSAVPERPWPPDPIEPVSTPSPIDPLTTAAIFGSILAAQSAMPPTPTPPPAPVPEPSVTDAYLEDRRRREEERRKRRREEEEEDDERRRRSYRSSSDDSSSSSSSSYDSGSSSSSDSFGGGDSGGGGASGSY